MSPTDATKKSQRARGFRLDGSGIVSHSSGRHMHGTPAAITKEYGTG
eukprot:CAMPEP_0117520814 /NCGR_PEP_ID=MMETSP0784-20121206/33359_1 /TAXON_ID=39447 /ORGANISM="" /LENGTH=46 /DNA_ID= /DNA_START= /DNA_END= /DNA_ORIENTATION=